MLGHVTDPTAPGGLGRRELPDPEPAANEVVVAVRAFSVNRGELRLLEQRPNGWMPGQDLAGVVVREAADGSGPPAGTRVVGVADGGGWSEQACVPAHRVAALPDGTSFADAAALPVAGLTALRALRLGGPLLGRPVLVTGASGGVGSFAVGLGRAAGARVTALVSGSHRVDAARALGADDVVTELGAGTGPFELILDGVGGTVLVEALHRLAPGGTLVAYGMAGGEPTSLSFQDFRNGALGRMVGFFVYRTNEQTFGADLALLAGLVADGRLQVPKGFERDWSATGEALDALRRRRAAGKTVLTVGS